VVDQINEAGIAGGDLDGEANDFPEHLVKRQLGTDNITNPME
jgi:hypothetical protein